MPETTPHTAKSYEKELLHLREMVARMGGLVEQQVSLATGAVVHKDNIAAAQAVEIDPTVDALEREVETATIQMIALRQPVADDLRQIVATLKAVGDLERIGDYAANIAKRSIVLSHYSLPYSLSGIGQMARLVQENLKLIIDAVGESNAEKAEEVWHSDYQVDDLYNTIFRELITYMMEDPRNITPCTHLLFIAKNFERIGDHATNIAETVHYAVNGRALSEPRPKGDASTYTPVATAGPL
jgi:phosphate transport system protein